jgi:Ca2+-binding RTX toxin-like protein
MNCTNGRRDRFRPRLEALEARRTPAFAALFDPLAHVLWVTGTAFPDAGTIDRDLAGNIRLDGNLIPGLPTVTNTDTINIATGDSRDFVQIEMANGLLAPGFTPDATGQSEIEIHVDAGPVADDIWIKGTQANDTIDAGQVGGQTLVNVNGDDDADIVVTAVAGLGLSGQDGNDRLSGAGTPVVGAAVGVGLYGDNGNDILIGGEGIFNSHFGGPGDDLMIGGKTIDRYFFAGGHLGNDTIIDVPDGNNDTLIFSDIDGSVGGNFVGPVHVNLSLTSPQVVNPGNLTLTLVDFGVDHVIGSVYDDYIIGNDHFQSILFGGHDLSGTSGNDILVGQSGNDVLYGEGGNDVLMGDGGDDLLWGGPGDDVLRGGAGADVLKGEAGTDNLFGGFGDDRLYGSQGRDFLFGNDGNDYLNGGDEGAAEDGARDFLTGGPGADWYVPALFDVFIGFNPAEGDHT